MIGPRKVAGHTLAHEGAPHTFGLSGRPVRTGHGWGTGGYGMALCSCGAVSEPLDSGRKRQDWHRAHKAEVRAEATQQ